MYNELVGEGEPPYNVHWGWVPFDARSQWVWNVMGGQIKDNAFTFKEAAIRIAKSKGAEVLNLCDITIGVTYYITLGDLYERSSKHNGYCTIQMAVFEQSVNLSRIRADKNLG
jgi:hypothetical protein